MTALNTDSSHSFTAAQRRQSLRLPSRRKHALMAATTFCVLAALPFLMTSLFGNADAAKSFGSVEVEPIKQAPALAQLDDEAVPVPDLLAGELDAGENPTETQNPAQTQTATIAPALDALGNPIGGAAATPAQTAVNNTPTPRAGGINSNGSKTILIDGQALGPTSLPPAPIAGLSRSNQYGSAPAKGLNGKTPLNSYNRPFSKISGKQPVSIIIGGLGVNPSVTQQAIDSLPPQVTLSFAAHTTGLQDWINRARRDGHEVMIEIPMESAGFNSNELGAERTLRATNEASDNLRHMDWHLSRAQGYFGVINFNGDSFLTRADATAPILGKLAHSGLGFITDGDFSAPSLGALSRSVNLPYKNSFGLIDPEPNSQLIRSQLSTLSSVASSGGRPIGVGFAYPQTIDTVARWIADLEANNLVLAPASSALLQ